MSLRFIKPWIFFVGLLWAGAGWSADDIVLVTHIDSTVTDVSSLDIRKAYLGVTVAIDGNRIRPVRRNKDALISEIFLQAVLAMSKRSYERRLLSLLLKKGMPRPLEIDGRDELIAALAQYPNSISYMWKSEAESDSRVKTLRVLWQER